MYLYGLVILPIPVTASVVGNVVIVTQRTPPCVFVSDT